MLIVTALHIMWTKVEKEDKFAYCRAGFLERILFT